MKHKITEVEEESIGSELGVLPGDFLFSINGRPILDVLDYRFRMHTVNVLVEIEKQDGEIWELDIEKGENEDIGLIFEQPLMSDIKLCRNKCIFCFVDQEPPGLRNSLYVKDDDWRLSFLHGNFVTLTNLSREEANRIAHMHLSPLNISVHTVDMDLRKTMMGQKNSGNLFHYLSMFSEAGIIMNFQIVLCKGINDGDVLNDSILMLQELRGANSLAVVPVGLTKHRNGLPLLSSFSEEEAAKVILQVETFQNLFIRKRSSAFVFLADEWYIMAQVPLPSYNSYEGFPQLSNGVGMIRLFEHDFLMTLNNLPKSEVSKSICIVTGVLASSFVIEIAKKFCNKFKNIKLRILEIKNHFYGESVTVSGLLTGRDIINQLNGICDYDVLFLPENAFRTQTDEMIDGATRTLIEETLNIRVLKGSQYGSEFAMQLFREMLC